MKKACLEISLAADLFVYLIHVFYKEHLYKEIKAEKGSKNKEFLRNFLKTRNQLRKCESQTLWKDKELQPQTHQKG